jgi:hypothetical protein
MWRSFRAKHFGVRWRPSHRTPKLREIAVGHASIRVDFFTPSEPLERLRRAARRTVEGFDRPSAFRASRSNASGGSEAVNKSGGRSQRSQSVDPSFGTLMLHFRTIDASFRTIDASFSKHRCIHFELSMLHFEASMHPFRSIDASISNHRCFISKHRCIHFEPSMLHFEASMHPFRTIDASFRTLDASISNHRCFIFEPSMHPFRSINASFW